MGEKKVIRIRTLAQLQAMLDLLADYKDTPVTLSQFNDGELGVSDWSSMSIVHINGEIQELIR